MPDRYAFGAARDLYAANVHPRVHLGPDDVVAVREAVRKGHARKIMDALRKRVHVVVGWIEDADDLDTLLKGDGTHHSHGSHIAGTLGDMGVVGAIDQDDRVTAVAATVMRYHMSQPRPNPLSLVNLAGAYDVLYDRLAAPDRRAFVRASKRVIVDLIDLTRTTHFRNAGGNVTLSRTLGAIWAMLAVAGEPGAGDVRKHEQYLADALEASINVAIHRDGYPEEDIGYGSDVAGYLVELAEVVSRAGIVDLFERCPRLLRFGNAMLHFVQPWGTYLANTGDFGGGSFGRREFALSRIGRRTCDPTMLWLLGTLKQIGNDTLRDHRVPPFTREVEFRKGMWTTAHVRSIYVLDELGGKAAHPSKVAAKQAPATAFHDERRGIASFRSGWDDNATYCVFDGSHRLGGAQGHAHASCGNFSLSALGEYFAVDCGRYNNEQNCHNVTLVDGKSGESTDGQWGTIKRAGAMIDCEPGDLVDYASVDSSHQHGCYWAKRYFGLVKPKAGPSYAWVVDDINARDDIADYWWQLHTSPENTIRIAKAGATITGWRYGNQLDVHFALPAPGEYPEAHRLTEVTQDEATSSSYKYIPNPYERAAEYTRPSNQLRYSVFVRPRLLAKFRGYDGKMMALMIPRGKGAAKARVQRLRSLPSSLAVEVTFECHVDTIIFAFEHDMLEAGGIKARGHWCYVRRTRGQGKVVDWASRACTLMQVDGRVLHCGLERDLT